jgi:adenylate cyclase
VRPIHGRLDLPFEAIGPLTLKNIAQPLEAFLLIRPRRNQRQTRRRPGARSRIALFAGLVGLLLVGAGGTGWWLNRGAGTVPPATQVSPTSAPATTLAYSPPNVGLSKAPRLSIVVLPFQNLSEDPKDNYLAEGITEDVTIDIPRVQGMFVIARKSAYAYQGKAIDVHKAGEELGVRYLPEGSVRKLGNTLRVKRPANCY